MSAGLDSRRGPMRAAMRFVVAEGGLAVFGPFRDIVRCFEDADHGTVVHHNLVWDNRPERQSTSSAGCAKD